MTQDQLRHPAPWDHPAHGPQNALLAEAIAHERARIVRDLHDGLGTQLSSLLLTVQSQPFTRAELVEEITQAIDQLRLEMDALDTTEANLPGLLGQIRYRLERRLRRAAIKVHWCIQTFPQGLVLAESQTHHLRHLLYEAFSNVIRHSRATYVKVQAHHDRASSLTRLVIEDDGRGFDPTHVKGRGLKNMMERAQQLGALLEIQSSAQSGTLITLEWR